MKISIWFQICILNLNYPIKIYGKKLICSSVPLLEFSEDCDAKDSIRNYKIISPAKKVNNYLNGQVKILFNEYSISDTFKSKRCLIISSIFRR